VAQHLHAQLRHYFSLRDGKIVSLAIIFNQPADY
jgi:hypothetical protein